MLDDPHSNAAAHVAKLLYAEPAGRIRGIPDLRDRRLNITIVTPPGGSSFGGNRTTAVRWQRFLDELGHATEVIHSWGGGETDVLIALHARKSFESIQRFAEERPQGLLVVALTGTDLYRDLGRSEEVTKALGLAGRVVVLQPAALHRLPPRLHGKVHVIHQSAQVPASRVKRSDTFDVCVLSHLREVKDPLLAASATRLLPETSRVVVRHAGQALDERLGAQARAESETNPRYEWVGPLPFDGASDLLAASRLLVLSSTDEGGANVISEAIMAGVPPLATDIPGSRGLLGDDYLGYYQVGDAEGLARLLARAESDPAFLVGLIEHCRRLQPLFAPDREREAWLDLLSVGGSGG